MWSLWRAARAFGNAGVSLYETTAVVAMAAIIAAVATPVIMDRIDDAKLRKALDETGTIRNAIVVFTLHTGRLPGEVEVRRGTTCFLQTGIPSAEPTRGTVLPEVVALGTATRPLDATSALGRPCSVMTPENTLNINDYLVRKPSETAYPNWQGPYMEPITSDPWDRAYVIHVLPQIFASAVPDPGVGRQGDAAGPLGYGWVLSAGPDRLLQTPFTAAEVRPGSDDRGAGMITRILPSAGGSKAPAF